ncbi:MAG: PAS domain S-box protein [Planctomycetaceae bacterium]|nr:PAS domain S-box protein [Planctomycetaceae bacterium]
MFSDGSPRGAAGRAEEIGRQFPRLVDLAPDAVFLHGLDGRFVYVNEEACACLGYNRDELLSMHPWDFVVNDSREHILRLWQGMVPGVPVLAEGLFRCKGGTTFPAEVRLARFEDDGRDWIVAFCRDITSRRRAEDALRSQERNRMARDIHDALAHGLTAIAVQLEAARQVINTEPDEVAVHVGNALRLARASLQDARRSMRALRPEALEKGDLAEALRQVVSHYLVGRPEKFHFRLHGRPHPLPGETEAHLLRVGQEALTNALKHARAANVRVELDYGDFEVRLHVEDDGQGFDPGAGQGEGVGLTGVKERAGP